MTAEPDATVDADAAPLGVSARPPRSLARAYWPVAATGALLALVPLWLGEERLMMRLAVDALVFGLYAVGFNVIFGSTNQLFLCVGALAGLGGYAAVILTEEAALPMAAGLVLATALATAVGGLLSWVAVRRSLGVIFTGIVTLTFSLSFANLLLGQRELTGGETGLVVSAGAGFLALRVVPREGGEVVAAVGERLERVEVIEVRRAVHDLDDVPAERRLDGRQDVAVLEVAVVPGGGRQP